LVDITDSPISTEPWIFPRAMSPGPLAYTKIPFSSTK
jgi:hypothetical protein